jgi:quercetin dioxygenase-like cupin family protein
MVQVKDKPPRILRAGDVAEVPPGLVHWHGAVAGHLFAHISLRAERRLSDRQREARTFRELVAEQGARKRAASAGFDPKRTPSPAVGNCCDRH